MNTFYFIKRKLSTTQPNFNVTTLYLDSDRQLNDDIMC